MKRTFTPNTGEWLVGNKLEKLGYELYLPARDVGVDLLAAKGGRFVRLQVKESRIYDALHSWTTLTPEMLTKYSVS